MWRILRGSSNVSFLARLGCSAAILLSVMVARAPGEGIAEAQVTLPPIPDPVAVTLDPSHTALLMLDFFVPLCDTLAGCQDSLPPMATLLGQARDAGALVIFTMPGRPGVSIEPAVAPRPDEMLIAKPQLETGFDLMQDTLQAHGIDTLIVTGVSAPLAMYTTWEATGAGYTVVVLTDGIPGTAIAQAITEYQSLNQPVDNNPDNIPLKPNAATLSRADLVSFR